MTKHLFIISLICLGIPNIALNAAADEVRVGIMVHDVDIPHITIRPVKERSASLTGEYIFETPSWLEWTHGARPYLYGSANLSGNTHHGGVGLNWRGHFLDNFYAEFGGGLSLHSGTKRIEFPAQATLLPLTTEQRIALLAPIYDRLDNEIEFGSTALFRAQIAIGYNFNERWGADIVYEHLSNGQILGGSENGGLDSVGLRLSRKF